MPLVGSYVQNAENATKRAAEVTKQLLTFAKGGDPVRATVDLAPLVREAADFVRHGTNVKVAFEIEPNLPPANIDSSQISRVVHNLVINAVQAMPEGGTVRIALCVCVVGKSELPHLSAGRYLRLSVADEGGGISSENIQRIFDPYFTTKPKGSGLGLATAHSIVQKHGGHIAVESAPGRGATFRVWLPIARSAPTQSTAPGELSQPIDSARILFMDDEDGVCQVARTIMKNGGHMPTVVHDGSAAVEAFNEARASGEPYDLVILDLTVPGGMGGRETVEKLRRIEPNVRVIASSGYANDPVMANYRSYGFTAVLPKPYDPESFTRLLNRVGRQ